MYLTCVFFSFLFLQIFGFNIDTNHFIVYQDPQRGDNYFGYTVMLYPGNGKELEKWIKIGAPKGQDIKTRFKHSGVVYNCPFLMESCQPVDIRRGFFTEDELLSGAWIGGSMDISYKFQRMAICGHRTIFQYGRDYNMIGSCYLADLNSTFREVAPLNVEENRLYKIGKGYVYNYGQGQVGMATHFPRNESAVLLGAPGVWNWAGTIVKIANEDDGYDGPIASKRIQLRRKRSIQKEYIADAIFSNINDAFDLFGYAINSGYFYDDKKLYYVASTPKDVIYRGKVVIFQFNENKPLKERTSMIGEQFGEYFGASIAVGDLNADGLDDLIVGAPFHTEKTFNEGAVYIFLGRKQGQPRKQHTLKGQQTNGQFGSALMFLGDLNNDTFGDLAIGAPYEEEFSGVLYIYNGNKDGIDPQPSQRIVGVDIFRGIRGFGISISRPADIDENGHNDLVVGAYKSGNAVLLRTNPVVVVEYRMKSIPNELKQDSTKFVLNICYWYSHFDNEILGLTRTLTVDELLGRASLKNTREKTKNIIIPFNRNFCENITVSLKQSKDYVTPITASLSYKLTDEQNKKKKEVIYISDKRGNGTDSFCVRCPVLDEYRSTRPSYIDVPFSLGCGSDNICQSKLTIEATFPELRENNLFVVGSMFYLNLQTVIRNEGEIAYATQLEVTLPDVLTFRQIPAECFEQQLSVILCNVHNKILTNEQKTLALSLDMKKVNRDNNSTHINITLKVITSSNNSNNDTKILNIILKRKADIFITGKSGQQSVLFGNKTLGMPNFTQIYQIGKSGVSPLEKVQVKISLPHAIKTSSGDVSFIKVYQPHAVFMGQSVSCSSNFNYIVEPKMAEVSEKLESDGPSSRKKRQVEVFKENNKEKKQDIVIEGEEYDIVPNRTYFLNCSTENVICSDIVCVIEPFDSEQMTAVIRIKMMLDPTAISNLVGEKDMVLYTTSGAVTIEIPENFVQNGNRSDTTEVSTLLINENAKKKSIAVWMIILAVIVGILLLVLIIYGLTKAGFFKRAKKEELKNLKAATQNMIASESTPENLDPGITCSTEGLVDEEDQIEIK